MDVLNCLLAILVIECALMLYTEVADTARVAFRVARLLRAPLCIWKVMHC